MRSSQVNFYLTRDDQAELVKKLDPHGSFIYIARLSQDGSPQRVESAEIRQMGFEHLKIYVTQSQYIDRIIFKRSANAAFVDELRSPVVEFSRCYQDDQLIRRGRLYFVNGYFDASGLINKDDDFLKWGNSLMRRARRMLRKDPNSFEYFGPEALRLKEMGLKMVFT